MLDLPQLYTRPSASRIIAALEHLRVEPASWHTANRQYRDQGEGQHVQVNEDGIPKYLTGIVSSTLSWIEDEDEREGIYTAASARLAERCGRTGRRLLLFRADYSQSLLKHFL